MASVARLPLNSKTIVDDFTKSINLARRYDVNNEGSVNMTG